MEKKEISIYKGKLSPIIVGVQLLKLSKCFPSIPKETIDILSERIKENNFTNERLIDAINNVIDTCVYPVPAIANIISFDKKIKLFTYNDLMQKADGAFKVFEYYKAVDVGLSMPMYANPEDFEKYHLTEWKIKKSKL